MKKFVCTVCGYVFEGEAAPAECPVCHAGADKFKEQTGEREWAAEHVIGVAQGVSEDILADLRANFEGECTEVGMYLAMARVAHREGYPEIGLYWEKAAWEEAEHASKFAELLGGSPAGGRAALLRQGGVGWCGITISTWCSPRFPAKRPWRSTSRAVPTAARDATARTCRRTKGACSTRRNCWGCWPVTDVR